MFSYPGNGGEFLADPANVFLKAGYRRSAYLQSNHILSYFHISEGDV